MPPIDPRFREPLSPIQFGNPELLSPGTQPPPKAANVLPRLIGPQAGQGPQIIPVENKTRHNDPAGWFFDGRVMRSDTISCLHLTLAGNIGTSPIALALVTGLGIRWNTARFIIGVQLSATLQTNTDQSGTASVVLARFQGAALVFTVLLGSADGAQPGVLIGAHLSTFNPLGAGVASTSKTVGMGFSQAPFYVSAGDILNWYLYKNSAGALQNFYANATIFSVPAE